MVFEYIFSNISGDMVPKILKKIILGSLLQHLSNDTPHDIQKTNFFFKLPYLPPLQFSYKYFWISNVGEMWGSTLFITMPSFKFLGLTVSEKNGCDRQTDGRTDGRTDGHVSDLIRVPFFHLRYGTLKR